MQLFACASGVYLMGTERHFSPDNNLVISKMLDDEGQSLNSSWRLVLAASLCSSPASSASLDCCVLACICNQSCPALGRALSAHGPPAPSGCCNMHAYHLPAASQASNGQCQPASLRASASSGERG